MKGIRVAVLDHATGKEEAIEVPPGEYLILCTTPCWVSHTQVYPKSGTHVLTVKGRIARPRTS